jgi:hypothetical protein
VSTLLLPAVGGTRVVASVAATANLLLAVIFLGEHNQRGLDHTTTETKHKVKSGLLLNVVVGESAAVFELLASEDESERMRTEDTKSK